MIDNDEFCLNIGTQESHEVDYNYFNVEKPKKSQDSKEEKKKKRESVNIAKSSPAEGKPSPIGVAIPPKATTVKAIDAGPLMSKPKPKTDWNFEEDPMSFHAKPKALSLNSLTVAREKETSDHIFSRVSFGALNFDKRLADVITKSTENGGMGLASCTRVQSVTIPLLLQRENVLVKSQTGSGKTLSYLIPILHDLIGRSGASSSSDRSSGTRALIVAPTRELCVQISDVLAKLTQACVWIVGGCISGGEKKKSEKARLRKGVTILVSTPGRLLDHMRTTESFHLNSLRWVVLDEADRLLDMGFEQTVLEIFSLIRGIRMPGLKEKTDKPSSASNNTKSSGSSGGSAVTAGSNQKKWVNHNAVDSKKCRDLDALSLVMVSATLTQAVRQLAFPVMSGGSDVGPSGFHVVDADREFVHVVCSPEDLKTLSVKRPGGVVSFDDHNDGGGMNSSDSGNGDSASAAPSTSAGGTYLEKGEALDAPSQLAQYYMMVTCKWRLAALLSFLRTRSHQKIVVFFATCDSVDYHALLLREADWPQKLDEQHPDTGLASSSDSIYSDDGSSADAAKTATAEASNSRKRKADSMSQPVAGKAVRSSLEGIGASLTGMLGPLCDIFRLHGNMPQRVRQDVYRQFCAASCGILLCTDVAARGLDLPHIDWILQYDPPCDTTDYVHRAGRTARRGLGGSALLFLLPSEALYVQLLFSHGLKPEPLSLQSLFLQASKHIPGALKFKNTDEICAVILQRRMELVAAGNKLLLSAGRQAFRSFVRAYATHSTDTKGIFKVQSLHLGHVAKCFALRESPNALRNHEDIIGKIVNGDYSHSSKAIGEAGTVEGGVTKPSSLTRSERDDKYALSKRGNGNSRGSSRGDSRGKKAKAAAVDKTKQKLRKVGKGSPNARPTASGNFRKTDGYFKKRLREQANSEFSG